MEQSLGKRKGLRKRPLPRSSGALIPAARSKCAKGRPSIEESKKKDVVSALLAAAGQCLEIKDSSEITVRQIAEIACVNQAMINYYFESKEGLFSSVLTNDIMDLAHKLNQFLREIDGKVKETHSIETLMKLIEDHFDECMSHTLLRDNFMDQNSMMHETYVRRLASRSYSVVVRIMAAFMRLGRCRTDLTPEHAGYVVCSLCAFPFLLSPVFCVAFKTKFDGKERESRRRAVALLLSAPRDSTGVDQL